MLAQIPPQLIALAAALSYATSGLQHGAGCATRRLHDRASRTAISNYKTGAIEAGQLIEEMMPRPE